MIRLALLCLVGLLFSGCPSPPPPPPEPTASAVVTPRWSDALARIDLEAGAPDWKLTPQPESGGKTGVLIEKSATCTGHLWRTRMSTKPSADRSKALLGLILGRVEDSGVTRVEVRDQGEVPLGTFSAYMVRLDGVLDGQPWSSRITATFVTRHSGRFYVEVAAACPASSFVERRTCFDDVTAAVTIQRERR